VRFSTVAGNKDSADFARDVRGFAVKLYTKESNWDIVGNNIPVFFIQDAIKFPDLIHAAKEEPDRGFPQAQTAHDNFWDFISLTPESMHMAMWIMSDRAIPRSFRFMEGFGVHSFRLVNASGKSTFVKFHWKPKLGLQSVVWNEAVKINGADPDFHRRDLWSAIQSGNCPEWELGLQLFDEQFADNFAFDVLDATKIIPEEQIPIRRVGRLVLDRCVDNFFAETEQVAFCTQNIVPALISVMTRRGVIFPTWTPSLNGWEVRISRVCQSMRRNALFILFSRTVIWPWSIPAPELTMSRTLGVGNLGVLANRLSAAFNPTLPKKRVKSCAPGRIGLLITTARHVSSTSAKLRSSRNM